jgi:hypothetical protein
MTELNQRARDQLMPDYWRCWKDICLRGCPQVSNCEKFAEGKRLAEQAKAESKK